MAPNLLKIHEQARDNLLERITQFLREDPRISAAWLTGSLAQGNADALSDLDLWLAIADPGFEEVKANRAEQIKAVGEPLLVLDQPNNAPPGGAFMLVMYAGPTFPLEVD